jgi:hypothetical protein
MDSHKTHLHQEGDYARLAYLYNTETVSITESYEIFDGSAYSNPFPRAPMVMEMSFMGIHDFVIINNHFKCCGNGVLENDLWDEEARRAYASELLKNYMDFHFSEDNLIMLGDLNDLLTDPPQHNVFEVYFDDPEHYRFADMAIAEGNGIYWSYPSWPSHLDHILVSDELFNALEAPDTEVTTIQIDDAFPGGWPAYEDEVSDHLPVALKFNPGLLLSAPISENPDFRLFPNPTNTRLSISLNSRSLESNYRIFAANGALLKEGLVTGLETTGIDVSDLPTGLYFIQIGTLRQKFLVAR